MQPLAVLLVVACYVICVAAFASPVNSTHRRGCGTPRPSRGFLELSARMHKHDRVRHVGPHAVSRIKAHAEDMERYIIPVAIHTFMEKKTDQISEQMMLEAVAKQIMVMNSAFAPGNIKFHLVHYEAILDSQITDNFLTGRNVRMNRMFCQFRRGGMNTLNIFIGKGQEQSPRVFAEFPNPEIEYNVLDGVQVRGNTLPIHGKMDNYNAGWSTIHGIGHWLGLLDTWGDAMGDIPWKFPSQVKFYCTRDETSDHIGDTPTHLFGWHDCARDHNTCPQFPGNDPTDNPMNEVMDQCIVGFTKMQFRRMRQIWRSQRMDKTKEAKPDYCKGPWPKPGG